MPGDNIDRAVKRGTGDLEGVDYEEIRYEGYGIGGAAVMVDCLTDNRTRTVADVRHAFTKHGGNLGTDGSVAFLFKHCGQFIFAPGTSEEKVMEAALEAGAEDVVTNDDGCVEVISAPDDFPAVKAALEKAGLKPEVAEVTMKPANETVLAGEDAVKMQKLLDALEALDDVQEVYTRRDGARREATRRSAALARPERMRILGIDPGLRVTGFGVIDKDGQPAHLCDQRLHQHRRRRAAVAPQDHPRRPRRGDRREHLPHEVAVEKVFVNVNPQSTLLLGQARGAAICAAVSRACRSPSTPRCR